MIFIETDIRALGLAAAFGAGAYAFALRMTRKQMNGLGARVTRIGLALVHICPAEKREEIVRIILGDKGQQ